jgi:hypothetical protein
VAGTLVDLGEFGLCADEADPQPFDLAVPAFPLGLGDASDQVVSDFDEAGALGGVRAQQRTADAPLLHLLRSLGRSRGVLGLGR